MDNNDTKVIADTDTTDVETPWVVLQAVNIRSHSLIKEMSEISNQIHSLKCKYDYIEAELDVLNEWIEAHGGAVETKTPF